MTKKVPIRIMHVYLSYFQENEIADELKQLKFRLGSLSFLKIQLQKENNSIENANL